MQAKLLDQYVRSMSNKAWDDVHEMNDKQVKKLIFSMEVISEGQFIIWTKTMMY
jgi:hypothetical protein